MKIRFQPTKIFRGDESIPVPMSVATCPNCEKRVLAELSSWDPIGAEGPWVRPYDFTLHCESAIACCDYDDEFWSDVALWVRSVVVELP